MLYHEYDLIKFSLMIDNTCHRKNSARQSEKRFFVLLFYIIFVVDPYGIWTLLKLIISPLNVNRYRFFKLMALTVNNLHSPAIRCPLNVNGLPPKEKRYSFNSPLMDR